MLGVQLSLFLWWLALLFLGFCLGICAAWIGAKRSGTGESLRDILNLTAECIRFAIARVAANITAMMTISALIFGGICFCAGYGWRDHQLSSNQHELLGMSILREYPAGNYDAVTESGTSFPFNPCPNSPRLAVGMYRVVKWEQRNGCKFVTYWLPKPDPTTGAIADAAR